MLQRAKIQIDAFPQITRETLAHYIMQAWTDPGIKLPESENIFIQLKLLVNNFAPLHN